MDIVLAVGSGFVLGLVVAVGTGVLFLADSGISRPAAFSVIGFEIYAGIAFMTWALVIRRRAVSLAEVGLRPAGVGSLLLMVPTALAVFFVTGVISNLTDFLFGDVPTPRDQLAVRGEMSGVDLLLLLIVVGVVGPIVEEVVFRGLLYRVLRARWGVNSATWVSALAFAVVHFIPLLFAVFLVFGLVLAAVAERFDSLYPPIVLHVLNNSAVVVILFAVS